MAPYADGVQLPVTEQLALTHLTIPMGPTLSKVDAADVRRCIETAISTRAA